MENVTKVGVGVMIWKDGKVLLGKRLNENDHVPFQYAFPGGHLEYGESFEECCCRETLEETGMTIKNIRFVLVGNVTNLGPRHYIQIGFVADWESGEPQTMEPDKCEGWEWVDPKDFPENMMIHSKLIYDSFKTGQNYYPDIS
ncbi:MAG: NUDIX domain-containing protein [Candidatus Paceibacterota bacterium]|jgi:8-oxo-dGTP diphosphatase